MKKGILYFFLLIVGVTYIHAMGSYPKKPGKQEKLNQLVSQVKILKTEYYRSRNWRAKMSAFSKLYQHLLKFFQNKANRFKSDNLKKYIQYLSMHSAYMDLSFALGFWEDKINSQELTKYFGVWLQKYNKKLKDVYIRFIVKIKTKYKKNNPKIKEMIFNKFCSLVPMTAIKVHKKIKNKNYQYFSLAYMVPFGMSLKFNDYLEGRCTTKDLINYFHIHDFVVQKT